ncbi:MAG: hypothetical protein V9G98_08485 [Candidatus Competibacter sp.]
MEDQIPGEPQEQKWIDPSRHDGTGTSFSDRATAQLELEKAKRDQDVEDVEIVETVVDDD